MPDDTTTKSEPEGFADLAIQPTGSGVADQETAYLQAALDGAADASVEAGIADEGGAYTQAMTPTEGGDAEDESAAQPS